jgi:hypothetical protein
MSGHSRVYTISVGLAFLIVADVDRGHQVLDGQRREQRRAIRGERDPLDVVSVIERGDVVAGQVGDHEAARTAVLAKEDIAAGAVHDHLMEAV